MCHTIQQNIRGLVLDACYAIFIEHVVESDTDVGCESVFNTYPHSGKTDRMLHLGTEITIKSVEAEV